MHSVARAIRRAGSTETEKLIEAFRGLELDTPFGPIVYRPVDHQSTMGAFVGQLARKNGKGVMVNWRYADGANYLPPYEEVRALRKD
jgi:branched-chain amino acid transport system substrate-binding protein